MGRILVIDDNQDIVAILRKRFEAHGFSIEVAGDGYAVLGFLTHEQGPDAVILDLFIPDRMGTDLICSVKSRWPGTKIFIYTAHDEYRKKMHLYAEYVTAFFCKTDGVENLIDAVKREVGT
jgi:DNA-binding NtrC family response regulator